MTNNNHPADGREPAQSHRPDSDRELLAHLERLTGRQIRSRQDISDYIGELSTRASERQSRHQQLKNALLIALLLVAAGQYYFIDVQLQILSQPTLTVFVPVKAGSPGPYQGG